MHTTMVYADSYHPLLELRDRGKHHIDGGWMYCERSSTSPFGGAGRGRSDVRRDCRPGAHRDDDIQDGRVSRAAICGAAPVHGDLTAV